MQLSRGRWVAIGLLVLVVALIGHGRTLVTEPVEVQRHYVDAVWLSVAAPGLVLLSALATPSFDFDRYTRDRGRNGVALDAMAIVLVCLFVATGAATGLDSVGVGTTLLFGVLALVVYLTAFAVFTLRASDHYERWSA